MLQEKEYEPLGATTTVKADVRVIAATNRSLVEQVARGSFREDLYYRLNVVRIVLPPLADRREDIPLLVSHFIRQFNAEQGKQIKGISEEAIALLMRHTFPGNVRELQNIIERAVVLCRNDRIGIESLPTELTDGELIDGAEEPKTKANPLLEAEAETILRTLREQGGHRGKTAAALGIDKSTLWRKMRKYAITYQ